MLYLHSQSLLQCTLTCNIKAVSKTESYYHFHLNSAAECSVYARLVNCSGFQHTDRGWCDAVFSV